jgi:septum formation protein
MAGLPLWREPVVLASGSQSRRRMLEAAGVAVIVDKPDLDEDRLKRRSRADGLGAEPTAEALAVAKAARIGPSHAGRIVVAGDQMLECEGEWFDKPADLAAAHRQLTALAGRTHRLVSAAVAMRDGAVLWQATDAALLTMRPLSAGFLDRYLAAVGDRACESVGGYQVEGLGIQLFERILGDHFTILGLPLLPLLGFLREQHVLEG